MTSASPTAPGWIALVALSLATGCAHAPPAPEKPAAPPATVAATAALQRRYAGTYLYAGADAERRAVTAAVERAIAGLSFLAKPVARQTLRQRAEIREDYTLTFDGLGDLEVTSKGFPVEFGPLGGKPFALETKYGDQTQITQAFVDGVLVQQGRTDDGSGRTEFRLEDDGATLLVHRVMESSQLTAPVDFTLTYRRQ